MNGMEMRPIIAGALLIAILLITGCKGRSTEPADGKNSYSAVVDLTRRAPIGYEICADHPLVMRRAKLTATFRLPKEIDFPPGGKQMGVKGIVFRPSEHEVDLYKNLHSERLLYATAPLYLEHGLPTIKVTLNTYKLPKGQYVLGISGDPFFVYCTIELQ